MIFYLDVLDAGQTIVFCCVIVVLDADVRDRREFLGIAVHDIGLVQVLVLTELALVVGSHGGGNVNLLEQIFLLRYALIIFLLRFSVLRGG